jgi:hypothetical protein
MYVEYIKHWQNSLFIVLSRNKSIHSNPRLKET